MYVVVFYHLLMVFDLNYDLDEWNIIGVVDFSLAIGSLTSITTEKLEV